MLLVVDSFVEHEKTHVLNLALIRSNTLSTFYKSGENQLERVCERLYTSHIVKNDG